MRDILAQTGITATAGIGTNMYLAKVAMDIVAKHMPADEDGVRVAELDEMSYRRLLWNHRPLTDFWRVGRGYARKLEHAGLLTMGGCRPMLDRPGLRLLQRGICSTACSAGTPNYSSTMRGAGSRARSRTSNRMSRMRTASAVGRCSPGPPTMPRDGSSSRRWRTRSPLDLVGKRVLTNRLTLAVGYDIGSLDSTKLDSCADSAMKRASDQAGKSYRGPVSVDRYGRRVPDRPPGRSDWGSSPRLPLASVRR